SGPWAFLSTIPPQHPLGAIIWSGIVIAPILGIPHMGTNSHSLHHPLPLSFGRAASLWGKGIHAMKLRKSQNPSFVPIHSPSLKAAPFLFALKVIALNN